MAIKVLFGVLMSIVSELLMRFHNDLKLIFYKGQTVNFLSGSADSTCKLWDCKTGL